MMMDEIKKYIEEQEHADLEYRRREYDFHVRAIDRGRREGKCQKCGGVGCLPCLYSIPITRNIDGKDYKWRRWVYAVKDCECFSAQKYACMENADAKEMSEVFKK
jgi:hypothetical protein